MKYFFFLLSTLDGGQIGQQFILTEDIINIIIIKNYRRDSDGQRKINNTIAKLAFVKKNLNDLEQTVMLFNNKKKQQLFCSSKFFFLES